MFEFLSKLLNLGAQQAPHQLNTGVHALNAPAAQPQPAQSARPDITYNPNPNTNIPYSAHTPALAQLGNRYAANPTSPELIGVDPAQFGFPADNTVRPPMPQTPRPQFQPRQY